jgi:hypothetical protein
MNHVSGSERIVPQEALGPFACTTFHCCIKHASKHNNVTIPIELAAVDAMDFHLEVRDLNPDPVTGYLRFLLISLSLSRHMTGQFLESFTTDSF